MKHVLRTVVVTAGLLVLAVTSHSDVAHPNTSSAAWNSVTPGLADSIPLGSAAITYEELSAAERSAVEQIREAVETAQLPASHDAFARATARTGIIAERELAARTVGLVGTENDGVIP